MTDRFPIEKNYYRNLEDLKVTHIARVSPDSGFLPWNLADLLRKDFARAFQRKRNVCQEVSAIKDVVYAGAFKFPPNSVAHA